MNFRESCPCGAVLCLESLGGGGLPKKVKNEIDAWRDLHAECRRLATDRLKTLAGPISL